MSRIDPDVDQARLRVEERQALLPLAPADQVAQVTKQIADARAAADVGRAGP